MVAVNIDLWFALNVVHTRNSKYGVWFIMTIIAMTIAKLTRDTHYCL